MIDIIGKKSYDIQDLLKIMQILRSENGCPWDREQDHHSIRNNFIEETYEVIEAIDNEDTELLKEELGDVLLQVVFHAHMEEEKESFCFDDVADGICRKLIERHPHIFGDVKVSGTDDVLNNWEQIKQQSKKQTTATQTLKAVPAVYPALMRAQKVQSRASKAGMDFKELGDTLGKLNEEMDELCLAVCEDKHEDIQEELGDLLFSVVNVARFLDVNAEEALQRATQKFISRFELSETAAHDLGIDMKTATVEELDRVWDAAKNKE